MDLAIGGSHFLPQNMNNTEIVIPVTRHYHWLVEPALYLHEKYFDLPVTFLSDRPIPGAVAVEAFPRDMQLYHHGQGAGNCGKLLKDALLQIDNPLVTITMSDMLPVSPVDMAAFEVLERYMLEHPGVARGNLYSGDPPRRWEFASLIKHHGELLFEDPRLSILKIPADNHSLIGQMGSTSLNPGLWRRDFLLEFVEDAWWLDSIELPGQYKFIAQDKWYSVATLPPLMDVCHLHYTSSPEMIKLSEIKNEEDRKFVERFVPEGFAIE